MSPVEQGSRNPATELETLPSEEEISKKLGRIIFSLREGSTNRYKNPIEEVLDEPEDFDKDATYKYVWKGDKNAIGFIGYPHYGVVKRMNEKNQKNEIIEYTLKTDIGVPVHVLQYVKQLDCIAVVRADVYAKP